MNLTHLRGSIRSLGVACTVLLLPLALVSCANAAAIDLPTGSPLRAATGADVFAEPSVQNYRVDSVKVTRPATAAYGSLALPTVESSGSLQLSDGVITGADLFVSTGASDQSISFTLTRPVVLRRDDSAAEPLTATGTLQVGTVQHFDTKVSFSPQFHDDGTALVDIEFDVPESFLEAAPQHTSVLTGGETVVAATVTLSTE